MSGAAGAAGGSEKKRKLTLRVVEPPADGAVYVCHFPSGRPPELSGGGGDIQFTAFQREGVAPGQQPQLMLRGRTVRLARARGGCGGSA
jgi:hypothetical protein